MQNCQRLSPSCKLCYGEVWVYKAGLVIAVADYDPTSKDFDEAPTVADPVQQSIFAFHDFGLTPNQRNRFLVVADMNENRSCI